MGMQITSLSMGTQDIPEVLQNLEKRPPLPAEQKAAAELAEVYTPPNTGNKTNSKPNYPDIKQTASELERVSQAFDRRFKFIIDSESREILIKVIDNETDKVIKVLPPEELQRLHSRIRETIGFLFDTMV